MTLVALRGPFTTLLACSEGAPEEAASFALWSSLLARARPWATLRVLFPAVTLGSWAGCA